LVDFTDLEILLLKLLDDESLAAQLSNPLQLAIFQQLRRLSPRSRWVGDPKQAIYGFRDTDPALVDDIWKNAIGAIGRSFVFSVVWRRRESKATEAGNGPGS